MLLLGIDVGTSSIKVSVVDSATQKCIASTYYPETEAEIISLHTGWAEQSPDKWWEDFKQALNKVNSSDKYDPLDIGAIGISYQMHGLVLLDKNGKVLKDVAISGSGKGSLTVDASMLSSGAYQYSLYVDGRLIGTKQMEHIR